MVLYPHSRILVHGDRVFMSAGKQVFINFHVSWCSASSNLKPTWGQLVHSFEVVDLVTSMIELCISSSVGFTVMNQGGIGPANQNHTI